jgi:L-lactate dehydrogenase complex protein LldE
MRIGLFIPCYVDAFHVEVGVATLELLERFGLGVEHPYDQTCCGQPMTNSILDRRRPPTSRAF